MTTAKIGLVLRDRYGIPDVKFFTGKKINKILSEKGVDSNKQDLQALEKRDKILQKHIEKNKGDITAKKGSQFAKAKIKRLKDYYSK